MTQRDPNALDDEVFEITDAELVEEHDLDTYGDLHAEGTGDFDDDDYADEATTVFDPNAEGTLDDDEGDFEDEATRVFDPGAGAREPEANPNVHVELGARAESPLSPQGPDPRAARQPSAAQQAAPAASFSSEKTVVTAHDAPQARPAVRQVATSAQARRSNAPLIVVAALLAVAIVVILVQPRGTEAPAVAPTATVAVFSSPAGAAVVLDGAPLADVTPMSLTGIEPGRTYELQLRLDGHEPLTETLSVETAGMESREFTLEEVTGALVIRTFPEGAAIAVDGEARGQGPLTLDGLDRSRAYVLHATLDGYEAVSETVRWESSSPAQMPVVLTLTPVIDAEEVLEEAEEAAAAEAAEARRAREATQRAAAQRATTQRSPAQRATSTTQRAPSEEPRRTTSGASSAPSGDARARHLPPSRPSARPSERPSAAAAPATPPPPPPPAEPVGEGTISVQALPYAQVYVNGAMISAETPVLNHRVPSGVHNVKVYFVALQQWSDERAVRVEPGGARTLTFRAQR